MSPFAKLEAISAVHFPGFSDRIVALDKAASIYAPWTADTNVARNKPVGPERTKLLETSNRRFLEAYQSYANARKQLLDDLRKLWSSRI
jgi:hypothetical protein